jgi:hypothetical protein
MTDETTSEESAKSAETVRRAVCSRCGGLRNCEIRGQYADLSTDGLFWGETIWYTLQCRGCDHVFVQTVSTNSEAFDLSDASDGSTECTYYEDIAYWPALSKRQRPDWMTEYSVDADNAAALHLALRELYGALNNDLNMLAAIGVRTCFDIASELLGVEPNLTFVEKLDALVGAKHIQPLDRERLDTAIEAGHASAHRGWRPQASDLDTMANILEDFVFNTFVQPYRRKKLNEKAASVRKTVPPKPPKSPKGVKTK